MADIVCIGAGYAPGPVVNHGEVLLQLRNKQLDHRRVLLLPFVGRQSFIIFSATSTTTGKKMKTIRGIIGLLQIPRAILPILLWKISLVRAVVEKDMERWLQIIQCPEISPVRADIKKDLERWLQVTQCPEPSGVPEGRALAWLLWRYPAFRNLFYYRIAGEERAVIRVLLELAKVLYRPIDTLYIYTPTIGPGLFIAHGFSTIISAESIGQNCWVTQQVTVGYSNVTDRPTIGDGVRIMPGAIVFGKITIGDNSIIGANAVVFKDVPPNCTVVGVPAYIVRCEGEKVKKPL